MAFLCNIFWIKQRNRQLITRRRHSQLAGPMFKYNFSADDFAFAIYPIHFWTPDSILFTLQSWNSRLKIRKLEYLRDCLMLECTASIFAKYYPSIPIVFFTHEGHWNSIRELHSIIFSFGMWLPTYHYPRFPFSKSIEINIISRFIAFDQLFWTLIINHSLPFIIVTTVLLIMIHLCSLSTADHLEWPLLQNHVH